MSVNNWKDTTSYGRSDSDRTPTTWTMQLGHLRIVVHRHVHYPNKWLVSCRELNLDCYCLDAAEVEFAQKEGLSQIDYRLTQMLAEIRKVR